MRIKRRTTAVFVRTAIFVAALFLSAAGTSFFTFATIYSGQWVFVTWPFAGMITYLLIHCGFSLIKIVSPVERSLDPFPETDEVKPAQTNFFLKAFFGLYIFVHIERGFNTPDDPTDRFRIFVQLSILGCAIFVIAMCVYALIVRSDDQTAINDQDAWDAAEDARLREKQALERERRKQALAQQRLAAQKEMAQRQAVFTERWREITELFIRHQIALKVTDDTMKGHEVTLDRINAIFKNYENCYRTEWATFDRGFIGLKEWISMSASRQRIKGFYDFARPVVDQSLPWAVLLNLIERTERNRSDGLITLAKALEEFDRIHQMIRTVYNRDYAKWKDSEEERQFTALNQALDLMEIETEPVDNRSDHIKSLERAFDEHQDAFPRIKAQ